MPLLEPPPLRRRRDRLRPGTRRMEMALAVQSSGRRQARVLRDAIAGGGAEPGAGGGDGDRVGCSVLHEEPHLVIGHVAAGHERSSEAEKAPA
jgi:hypothetical protein